MLRLSLNLLSSELSLLRQIKSCESNMLRESFTYYRAFSVSVDSMMELALTCEWVANVNEKEVLTDRGHAILEHGQYGIVYGALPLMLEDYITKVKPIWRSRIPHGRKEASIFMSKDERACFEEADLLSDSPSSQVIDWWDNISLSIRDEKDSERLATGRKGEVLSIEYECNRTHAKARWMSIDSNDLGYDIISQQSELDATKRLIEVKATTYNLEHACFYVSKNEWEVAQKSENYYFHLWLLSQEQPQLAVITPEHISPFIPINQKNGEWENASVPYKNFSGSFVIIHQ